MRVHALLVALFALGLSALPALSGEKVKSRKADPKLGAKAKTFVKNVALYRAYRDVPAKAKKAKTALEKLKSLEGYAWKGLAKAFVKYFFGAPIPGAKSKRTLLKKVDDLPVTYYFDLPRGYNPGKAWALCIALHGGGAGSGDGSEAMSTFGRVMGRLGAIAAAPTAPELLDGAWNCPRGYRVVRALIEEVSTHYHVDWNRVYVGGHSMGGYGSYFEAVWWPDRFAAHLSSAGGISAGSVCDFEVLYNTPLFVIHGTEDSRQAPITFVRAADKAIRMLPLQPRFYNYLEIEGAGHGYDGKYRKQAAMAMWKHTRDPYPKKVVAVCPNYWDTTPGREMGGAATGGAFWVEILQRDGADFDSPAKVVAEWSKANTFTVTTPPIQRVKHTGPADQEVQLVEMTNTVRKIGICLSEDHVDLSKPVKILLNGSVVFEDFVDRSVDTLLERIERTRDPGLAYSARVEITVP
ncbi:MAG: carboxylesterase family protein [Planctomycetota bacterium]|jgi:pimeloyl-ACP methyl ester carboxylesterase